MRRPRLLLTGFGPFPGAPRNPTEVVVARLAARADLAARIEIVGRVLPVTWDAIAGFETILVETDPDAVLLLGLARRASVVRVEARARNRILTAVVDAAGRHPHARLDGEDMPFRPARAPIRAMTAAIAALGLPAAVSGDAGAYLCNALLWRALGARPARPTAFVHLPPTREVAPRSPWRAVDLERAVAAAIGPLTATIGR
ncbi:hypothetical protein [Pinisolibacter aquiterrae]|uniref:pyroglutamyl-peptidase I family protein n=1 Tax=Pinisolibacter aquiterrae TaxID=2815579 RepID=UPI001C3D9291|nr:hypothetical protein [Pinisolibacter aquiterrae]MBV5263227.1 hypothetical protein [Pinisolibacter aquiterrae]MCC8234141.1 hypothetical protein [Pinisolibacter aquiterrae]